MSEQLRSEQLRNLFKPKARIYSMNKKPLLLFLGLLAAVVLISGCVTPGQDLNNIVEEGKSKLCGNGNVDIMENCGNCPEDAGCGTGFECSNKTCVAAGTGDAGDGGSGDGEETNGGSTGDETCGNGVMDFALGEDCETCPADVQCPEGYACIDALCKEGEVASTCGDDACTGNESYETCPEDCEEPEETDGTGTSGTEENDPQFTDTFDVYEIIINQANARTVYAATEKGLFKTKDDGDSWEKLDLGIGTDYITALDMSPSNPNILYAGTDTGAFVKTVDAGKNWTELTVEGLDSKVNTVAVNKSNSMKIYLATDSGVYKTIDSGANWVKKSGGLPDGPVNDIVVDRQTPTGAYAATDSGVYKTTNEGGTWGQYSEGLGTVKVNSISGGRTEVTANNVTTISETSIIYAGTNAGFYKSLNSGSSWSEKSEGLASLLVKTTRVATAGIAHVKIGTVNGGYVTGNGGISWTLMALPETGKESYVISIDMRKSNHRIIYVGTRDGLFKTTLNGESFTKMQLT